MFASLGFTIAGLIFMAIIATVYYNKKKYDNIESKIYNFLLIVTILLHLIEIIVVFT